jgi:hypothetical protein
MYHSSLCNDTYHWLFVFSIYPLTQNLFIQVDEEDDANIGSFLELSKGHSGRSKKKSNKGDKRFDLFGGILTGLARGSLSEGIKAAFEIKDPTEAPTEATTTTTEAPTEPPTTTTSAPVLESMNPVAIMMNAEVLINITHFSLVEKKGYPLSHIFLYLVFRFPGITGGPNDDQMHDVQLLNGEYR